LERVFRASAVVSGGWRRGSWCPGAGCENGCFSVTYPKVGHPPGTLISIVFSKHCPTGAPAVLGQTNWGKSSPISTKFTV
jgi:hypothetical protein